MFFFCDTISLKIDTTIKKGLTLLCLMALGISCRPGASQPPRPSQVIVHDPLYDASPAGGNQSSMVIASALNIEILTSDSEKNNVLYPNQTRHSHSFLRENRNNRTQPFTQSLSQPKGQTVFLPTARVQSQECGWPIYLNHFTAQTGGHGTFEAIGPILKFPESHSFIIAHFQQLFSFSC